MMTIVRTEAHRITSHPRRGWRAGVALFALLSLPTLPALAQTPTAQELARQVEIRRTTYGVPHILAQNLRAGGYGMAYAQLEDYGARIVMGLVRARGELALHYGQDSLDVDFQNRPRWLSAANTYPLLSADVREIYEGFAVGVNRYIELHPQEFPDWVKPDISAIDVATLDVELPGLRGARRVIQRLHPQPASMGRGRGRGNTGPVDSDLTPDEGSNAWALAPSRTRSGKAILLRNPHLSWTSGYYEAQLTIPGVVNWYGDFRIGGPFDTIGGFNDRLGWSTTNNSPDPDEVYALDADPAHPDHYLFEGASIPLQRQELTLQYKNGDALGSETRATWSTDLGPVIYRGKGKIYVLKSAARGFRLGQQWLEMMRAQNLAEWKQAMRLLSKTSSNFTYADADGNIFYVWYGMVPELPRAPGGDSVAVPAHGASDVWTRKIPFDSLPQLRNPKGGYLHNENDPFYYANLNQPFDPKDFPANFPRPRLGLRSQKSISLIGGKDKLSLEDVVHRKYNEGMLLADRVKDDLVAAVRANSPSPEVQRAVDLVANWDNTVAAESRGSVLFTVWWDRYRRSVTPEGMRGPPDSLLYHEPWTAAAPATTPRGLADPKRAAEAFTWAVSETQRRYGAYDVAWGDVHRVRLGNVDLPVGGCNGALGCFRVLWYTQAPDGKLVASGGDGWVIAVEFTNPPHAYSILAYGESSRADSPHHSDQADMFVHHQMKKVAFTEKEIAAQLVSSYHPGLEN